MHTPATPQIHAARRRGIVLQCHCHGPVQGHYDEIPFMSDPLTGTETLPTESKFIGPSDFCGGTVPEKMGQQADILCRPNPEDPRQALISGSPACVAAICKAGKPASTG